MVGSDGPSGTVDTGAVGPGAVYELHAGVDSTPRKFALVKNGTRLLAWTDSSNVTALGGSNRGWGWGGRTLSIFGSQRKSGAVTYIAITDAA